MSEAGIKAYVGSPVCLPCQGRGTRDQDRFDGAKEVVGHHHGRPQVLCFYCKGRGVVGIPEDDAA